MAAARRANSFGDALASVHVQQPTSLSQDHLSDFRGGVLLECGEDVGIRVEGDAHVGMTETLAHHLGWNASRQGGAGVAVPNIVKADPREPGGLDVAFEEAAELMGVDKGPVL